MSRPVPVVVRILAQRQPVDTELFAELVEQECADLGISAQLSWIDDLASVPTVVSESAAGGQHLVLVTAPDVPDLVEIGLGEARLIRVDLHLRNSDPSPGLRTHIQGRGIEGVCWALRTLHHHSRWPQQISRYGDDPLQFGALRLANGNRALERTGDQWRQPVVVLLHGGFWRARWQLDLMDALAVDLAERGVASWNVEYRPPDRHGWAATVADIRTAVAHVSRLAVDQPVDPNRVALVGHSAGGQLAVQLAADLNELSAVRSGNEVDDPFGGLRPRLVVQLAGLVDLVETDRRDIGNGAVPTALGGAAVDLPEVYAAASPLLRVPVGVRQLVVIGRRDGADLREMSRRYVRAAVNAGDEVELIEDDGDHFTVIDPASRIWRRTAEAMAKVLVD